MNREIKFRAWDKNRKVMAPVVDIQWRKHQVNIEEVQTLEMETTADTLFITSHVDHYELMQFTGLKDKNGKEIYEGDILKRTDDSLRLVKWSKFGFELFALKIPDRYWNSDYLDWEQSEVIGNIYENPELLSP